jgi:ethanolamine ammonia-lyase small subunit
MAGKGSRPRPFSVTLKNFDESHVRIFGNEERDKASEEKKKADDEYWAKIKEETAARIAEFEKSKNKGK